MHCFFRVMYLYRKHICSHDLLPVLCKVHKSMIYVYNSKHITSKCHVNILRLPCLYSWYIIIVIFIVQSRVHWVWSTSFELMLLVQCMLATFTSRFFVHEKLWNIHEMLKIHTLAPMKMITLKVSWLDFFNEFVMVLVWKVMQCMKC